MSWTDASNIALSNGENRMSISSFYQKLFGIKKCRVTYGPPGIFKPKCRLWTAVGVFADFINYEYPFNILDRSTTELVRFFVHKQEVGVTFK